MIQAIRHGPAAQNQPFIFTGLGTPSACILSVTTAVTSGVQVSSAVYAVGFSDGVNHRCASGRNENSSNLSKRRRRDDVVLEILDSDGTALYECLAFFANDTILLQWTPTPPPFLVECLAFFDALGATVLDIPDNDTGDKRVEVGHPSRAVFVLSHTGPIGPLSNTSTYDHANMVFGVCANDGAGGIVQNAGMLIMKQGGTADWIGAMDQNFVGRNFFTSLNGGMLLTAFDATGFTNSRPIAIGAMNGGYALCLDFPERFWTATDVSPTTSSKTYSPGFKVQSVGVLQTRYLVADFAVDTGEIGAAGLGFGDANDEASIAIMSEEAANPQNTKSLADTGRTVNTPEEDGAATNAIRGTLSIDPTSGFDIDYESTDTAERQQLLWAFEDPDADALRGIDRRFRRGTERGRLRGRAHG